MEVNPEFLSATELNRIRNILQNTSEIEIDDDSDYQVETDDYYPGFSDIPVSPTAWYNEMEQNKSDQERLICSHIIRHGIRIGRVCSAYVGDKGACPHHIEKTKFTENKDKSECLICHSEMEKIEWRSLCCRAVFHQECIKGWLKEKKIHAKCPQCRKDMHCLLSGKIYEIHSNNIIMNLFESISDKFDSNNSSLIKLIDDLKSERDREFEEFKTEKIDEMRSTIKKIEDDYQQEIILEEQHNNSQKAKLSIDKIKSYIDYIKITSKIIKETDSNQIKIQLTDTIKYLLGQNPYLYYIYRHNGVSIQF